MLDLFPMGKRRGISDLNVVPILDMLICVIFFLLLGTSFMEYTKQSLPPSSVSSVSDPALRPLAPQLTAIESSKNIQMTLSWTGNSPGKVVVEMPATRGDDADPKRADLLHSISQMIDDFSAKFPTEKTLRIGLGANVPYQTLITIMDAVKEKMPDMVLFSYDEAKAKTDNGSLQ
jgi:biopolymer transport protein ExbD